MKCFLAAQLILRGIIKCSSAAFSMCKAMLASFFPQHWALSTFERQEIARLFFFLWGGKGEIKQKAEKTAVYYLINTTQY